MAELQYLRAMSVELALELARTHRGEYVYSAGGTDVQIRRKQSLLKKSVIIDLAEIRELRGVRIDDGALVVGSMTTLDDLISSKEAREFAMLLVSAAQSVATPVIRMTATVGGNILVANRCTHYNQSAEWRASVGSCLRDYGKTCLIIGGHDKCFSRNVSDLAPALIALDAEITIQDQSGLRSLPLASLYSLDGIHYHANLDNDAIVRDIRISLRAEKWWYRKLRRRESIDFTSLTLAAVRAGEILRICLNGVSMSPVLVTGDLSTSSPDELRRLSRLGAKAVDNDLLPLAYRRDMIDVFVEECWAHCTSGNLEKRP
jgi:CO/xanthine dehydrogenase FAD-binding subunit